MCLYINRNFHTSCDNTDYIIAKDNLVVYKDLVCSDNGNYYTPFFGMEVNFNEDGVATLESDLKKKGIFPFLFTKYSSGDIVITKGIHSNTYCILNECYHIHYAIIPRGTRFYIGNANDVVSETLLVFENSASFFKYAKDKEVVRLAEYFAIP